MERDKILTVLFDEEVGGLHLHKPNSSPLYPERLLLLSLEKYHKRTMIHEYYYLKNEYNLSRIHLNQLTDQSPTGCRGWTTRNCSDLSLLKETKEKADDIFSTYISDSIKEEDHKASFNIQQIEETAKRGLIDRYIFAAGGMNVDNVELVKDYGLGGVIMRGDLWSRSDIRNEAGLEDLMVHLEKLRKAIGQEHESLQLKNIL